MAKLLLCALMVLAIGFVAKANDYYVDASRGSDDSAGTTLEAPWKTIAKANASLQPGDTVYVRAGVYAGEQIAPSAGGAENARITYTAYEGETPEVTGGRDGSLVALMNKSYVTVKGFKLHSPEIHDWTVALSGEKSRYNVIENCDVTDPEGYVLIDIANGASYNTVTGCTLYRTGQADQESGDGIVMNFGAHHNTASKNRVYDCCHSQILVLNDSTHNTIVDNDLYSTDREWAGAGVNCVRGAGSNIITGNRIHDLGFITDQKCAIQIDSSDNSIHNNVIFNVGAFGISLQSYQFGSQKQTSARNLVANNTVYNTGRQGLTMFSKKELISRDNRIVNNVVAGAPADWYGRNAWIMVFDTYHLDQQVEPGTWFDNVIENNVFFHEKAGEADMFLFNRSGPATTWSLGDVETAYPANFKANREAGPDFAAPDKGDFSLKATSTLIDAGIDVGLPFEGTAPDIGAIEAKVPLPAE